MAAPTYQPCGKIIKAQVPGTQIECEFPCMLMRDHDGHHKARGTFNGFEFEVEYAVE